MPKRPFPCQVLPSIRANLASDSQTLPAASPLPVPSALKNMPLKALATRLPIRELVKALEKIPEWLSDVSASRLLVPGTVQP